MKNNQPIGILGGTFDPIHFGHLYIAQAALENLQLEKVAFLPCYQPVHRSEPQATVAQRLEMINLAINNHTNFCLDDREIKRQEPSFMIDTLMSLRKDYPTTSLCLLLGVDAYFSLQSWKRWQELLDYAHLVVFDRPSFEIEQQPNAWLKNREVFDKSLLTQNNFGSIFLLKIKTCAISATNIRQKISQKEDVSELLPSNVLEYIQQHRIYS